MQDMIAAARRQQILDAAVEVIGEQGYQRATIRQIAKQAGVADGTIYNYFDNKDGLLLALVERLAAADRREADFARVQEEGITAFAGDYLLQRMGEIDAVFGLFRAVVPATLVDERLQRKLFDLVYRPAFETAERALDGLLGVEDEAVYLARIMSAPLLGLLFLRLLGDQHVDEHWGAYSERLATIAKQLARIVDDAQP